MDRWGDHALTCSCNGDRTVRHNAIRNVCYEEAVEASLRPEREKAGLLPGRPHEDGLPGDSGLRLTSPELRTQVPSMALVRG